MFRSAPPQNRDIDPDLSHSYVDQFVVGVERGTALERRPPDALCAAPVSRLHGLCRHRVGCADSRRAARSPVRTTGSARRMMDRCSRCSSRRIREASSCCSPIRRAPFAITMRCRSSRTGPVPEVGAAAPGVLHMDAQSRHGWQRPLRTTSAWQGDTGEAGAFLSPNNQINLDGRAPF